ncbi:MAG: AAA family ATPase [Bacteroidia bacterium]
MTQIKIPYGISNFEVLVREDFHYVDKTHYIETLEKLGDKLIIFLRPRRFGKSLFVSVLSYYYDLYYKEKFTSIFQKYYIGKNPTSLKNTYAILKFDFSGILTETVKDSQEGFLTSVYLSIDVFIAWYFPEWDKEKVEKILKPKQAYLILKQLFGALKKEKNAPPVYVLIDEYDHFTNELLSFDLDAFKNAVSKNGWVRKFYETLKIATSEGIVDRIFITGVSPVTLDGLTSGFNILKHKSTNASLNEMMGFKKDEVAEILLGVGVTEEKLPRVMKDLKLWYDGYLFSTEANTMMYNSDMVLYFAYNYAENGKYPRNMLDINIMSDYSKIRKQFRIGGRESENIVILDDLLRENNVYSDLTEQFTFEKNFDRRDFMSLIYYNGLITIRGLKGSKINFKIPNYVIKRLYFDYFRQTLMEKAQITGDALGYEFALDDLLFDNNIKPLIKVVNDLLKRLSNRDSIQFDEKHLKMIFATILSSSDALFFHSEYETNRGFVDIFWEKTVRFTDVPFQFIFEFKYISKTERKTMSEANYEVFLTNAKNQLLTYKQTPYFQDLADLKAYLIVYSGEVDDFVGEV